MDTHDTGGEFITLPANEQGLQVLRILDRIAATRKKSEPEQDAASAGSVSGETGRGARVHGTTKKKRQDAA